MRRLLSLTVCLIALAGLTAATPAPWVPQNDWSILHISNNFHPCSQSYSGGYWCYINHSLFETPPYQVSYVYGGSRAPQQGTYHTCSDNSTGAASLNCIAGDHEPFSGPGGAPGFWWQGCDENDVNEWEGYTDGTPHPIPPISWDVTDTFHRAICDGGLW